MRDIQNRIDLQNRKLLRLIGIEDDAAQESIRLLEEDVTRLEKLLKSEVDNYNDTIQFLLEQIEFEESYQSGYDKIPKESTARLKKLNKCKIFIQNKLI